VVLKSQGYTAMVADRRDIGIGWQRMAEAVADHAKLPFAAEVPATSIGLKITPASG
jgi:hypothetical protein